MERLLGTVQVIAEANSRYSSLLASPRSPPRTFPETHESSEDLPAPRIDPQDQLSDQAALPRVQPTVPSSTIEPAAQTSTDVRDRSLEDALARSRTERLTRANIQGAGSPTSAPLARREEVIAPAPTEYLRDTFQRVLDYMSLHPQEPGDPPQRPAPSAHPLPGDEPRPPARDSNGLRRNTAPTNTAPTDSIPTNSGVTAKIVVLVECFLDH